MTINAVTVLQVQVISEKMPKIGKNSSKISKIRQKSVKIHQKLAKFAKNWWKVIETHVKSKTVDRSTDSPVYAW